MRKLHQSSDSAKHVGLVEKYKKLEVFFLSLILFLIPSNLFFKFWTESAYVHGLLIDYLIPKIYLSDICIIPFCVIVLLQSDVQQKIKKILVNVKKQKKAVLCFLILITLFILRQFFSSHPIASVWFSLKVLEMSVFFFCLICRPQLWKKEIVIAALTIGVLFQSWVGARQFITQSSTFRSYVVLGEVTMSRPLGLDKGIFFGREKILPYGTTAHPNILAGYLVIGILFLIAQARSQSVKTKIITASVVAIGGCTLFLTQSISAWLVLGMAGVIFIFWKVIRKIPNSWLATCILLATITVPTLIHLLNPAFPHSTSINRREILNQAGIEIFLHNPVLGIGVNTFTAELENYVPRSAEVIRFIQPAHHIGILFLAEGGLLGMASLALLAWLFRSKKLLSSILLTTTLLLPILTLDHYLYTQQTGLLLLIFTLAFAITNISSDPEYN